MALNVLFFLALIAGSLAVPINQDYSAVIEKCSEVCPLVDYPKLGFVPQKTYVYSYTGSSQVQLTHTDVKNGSMEWKSEVEMSWFSPCQFTVQIKNPIVNEHSDDAIVKKLLTTYPLVVTMTDGTVSGVCAHPDDYPTSLNMKKGIVSAMQMTLPYFSHDSRGQTVVELDVLGRCPTLYSVSAKTNSNEIFVNKAKDHKECDMAPTTLSDNSITSWLSKSPFPLTESSSKCLQVWDSKYKILKKSSCQDFNQGKLLFGAFQVMNAYQSSELIHLKTVDKIIVPAYTEGIRANLTFSLSPHPKDEKIVPKIEELLTKLCSKVEGKVSSDAAFYWAKIVGFLHKAPEDSVKQLLANIRSGKYCKDTEVLEELYKDAIIFVNNGGAISTIVDETLSGKVSAIRVPFYTIAIHLTSKPCIHSVEAVKRLLESKEAPSSMKLAGGTLVSKYCKLNKLCVRQQPIKHILSTLSQQLDKYCPKSLQNVDDRLEALTVLKTIGNLAVNDQKLSKSIMNCARTESADTIVRVAAAQSYRQVKCEKQPTNELVQLVLKSKVNTEVRIASYVTAIRCSSFEQSSLIVERISSEANTQVRSFILSHMKNLQSTDAPYLRGVRYNLSSLIIPNDYEEDYKQQSKSMEMSYYLPSMGVGAGIDSSVIYTPGSYIPRQWQANFTANLFDNVINIGEIAIRMEDIESVYEIVAGSEGYLARTEKGQILKDLMALLKGHGTNINEHFNTKINLPKNTELDLSSILSNIQSMLKSGGEKGLPRIDTLSRVFGQEFFFTSMSGDLKKIKPDQLVEKMVDAAVKIFWKASDIRTRLIKSYQHNMELFIPTQQGIPLETKLVVSLISSMKINGSMSIPLTSYDSVQEFSLEGNAFAGYNFGPKAGVRFKGRLSAYVESKLSVNAVLDSTRISIDGPVQLIDIKFNTSSYMFNKLPSRSDVIIAPLRGSYKLVERASCSPKKGSLEICSDFIMPDPETTDFSPLGDFNGTIIVRKSQPSKELLALEAAWSIQKSKKSILLKLEHPAAAVPKVGEIEITYTTAPELKSFLLYLEGSRGRKSIQLDVESKTTQLGKKMDLSVYTSDKKTISSVDKVLTFVVGGRRSKEEKQCEVVLQTLNGWKKYVIANIESDATVYLNELGNAKSLELRKFEVDVGIPKVIRSINYIRQKSSGRQSVQYRIQSLTKTPERDLLSVTGNFKKAGSIERTNLESRLFLEVKTPSKQYETETKVIYNRRENSLLARLSPVGGQKKNLVLLDLSINKKASASKDYETKALLEVSSFPTYLLQGVVSQERTNKYTLKLKTMKDQQISYSVEGPITWMSSESQLKQQSEIKIKSESSAQEYLISSKFNLSPKKQEVKFELKRDQKSLLALDGRGSIPSWDKFSATVGITIPELITAKISGERSSSILNFVYTGYISPNTKSSQKMRGTAMADLSKQTIEAKLNYNLEKDPKSVFELRSHYIYNPSRYYYSLKGDILNSGIKSTYETEMLLGSLNPKSSGRNDFKLRYVLSDGSVGFGIQTGCKVVVKSPSENTKQISFDGSIEYPSKSFYKMDGQFTYAMKLNPLKVFIEGKTTIKPPAAESLKLDIDCDIDFLGRDQKMVYKMKVSGLGMQKPLLTNIDFKNKLSELQSTVLIDLGDYNTKLESSTSAKKNSNKQIEDFAVLVDMQLPNQKEFQLKSEKILGKKFEISFLSKKQKVLAWELSNKQSGEWNAVLTLPSRVIEGSSKIKSQLVQVKLDTKKGSGKEQYQALAQYNGGRSLFGASANGEVKLMYPGLDRPVLIKSNVDIRSSSAQGSLELDIFKNPKDKLIFDTETVKLNEGSYKMTVTIRSEDGGQSIKAVGEVALSPKMKLAKLIIFEADKLIVPTFLGDLSISETSPNNVYFGVKLMTSENALEVMGNFKSHELYQCRGGSVNGTIKFQGDDVSSYDFVSSLCGPAYVEVGIKESQQDKIFIAKLGMKNPSAIKLAVDLVYNSTNVFNSSSVMELSNTMNLYGKHIYLPKQPVWKIGAKLSSSKSVALEANYDTDKTQEYLNDVLKPVGRKLKKLAEEIRKSLPVHLSSQLSPMLYSSIKDEVVDITKEMYESTNTLFKSLFGIELDWASITEKLSSFYSDVIESLYKFAETCKQIIEKYTRVDIEKLKDFFKSIEVYVHKTFQAIYDELDKLVNSFVEGNGLEALKEYQLFKSVESSSISLWIVEKVKSFKQTYAWECIDHCYTTYGSQLSKDIKSLTHKVIEMSHVKQTVSWMQSWSVQKHDTYYGCALRSLLQRYYAVYLSEKKVLVRVQVPLRRPIASLSSAVSSVGVSTPKMPSNFLRYVTRPSSIIESVLPRLVARAQINKDQFTTLDGVVVPMIKTKCEIVFAKASGIQVDISKPTSELTTVLISSSNGKEFVFFHHRYGKNPILKDSRLSRSNEIQLLKQKDGSLQFETKPFRIVADKYKIEVEAKPESYNKVQGLMGTHDSEKSTDILSTSDIHYRPSSSAGSHHLSLESSRKLFQSNRLNKSCQIPAQ